MVYWFKCRSSQNQIGSFFYWRYVYWMSFPHKKRIESYSWFLKRAPNKDSTSMVSKHGMRQHLLIIYHSVSLSLNPFIKWNNMNPFTSNDSTANPHVAWNNFTHTLESKQNDLRYNFRKNAFKSVKDMWKKMGGTREMRVMEEKSEGMVWEIERDLTWIAGSDDEEVHVLMMNLRFLCEFWAPLVCFLS